MIVLLLFLYPMLSSKNLVGTDLTQAVPLTAAAAAGALIFGSVQFGVTASIVIGSVPAVLIGSLLSSRAPDRYLRPVITFVIFASGLKYVGVGTTALGWILAATVVVSVGIWLTWARPWRARAVTPGACRGPGGSGPGARPHQDRLVGARKGTGLRLAGRAGRARGYRRVPNTIRCR